jgi:hypothetical protein
MKIIVLISLLFPVYSVFAQNRNQQVRELNHIIELMNAFALCNQTWYFDAIQLQKALQMSSEKLNENYFYCSKTQHSGPLTYSGIESAFRFAEITPNAQKQIPAYQADYIPWFEAKETAFNAFLKPSNSSGEIPVLLSKYIASSDSLYAIHTLLNSYIFEKKFRSDQDFQQAQMILKTHAYWFNQCSETGRKLDQTIVEYCNLNCPPLQSHPELKQGLQELNLTMKLLTDWEKELDDENSLNNAKNDSLLRFLNDQGLKKDSLYLSKTRGYGKLNSGFWLHTRYRTFYTSMNSGIYWFAKSKHQSEKFIKQSQQTYNDFVRNYNSLIENYNDYIAIADGLTYIQTTSCCLSPSEIDTNQNVLLMAPKLPYKFEYPLKATAEPSDSILPQLNPDAFLISKVQPHHLVYLLDASSSMNESGKLANLKENTSYLVEIQRAVDQISIVTFSGKSEVLLQAASCDQKKYIQEKINHIHAFGQTNIHNGFETVKALLTSYKLEKGVNSVLLLTDGEFQLKEETLAIIKQLKVSGIQIYFVYLGKPLKKKTAKSVKKTVEDLGVIFYDTNRIDLKEVLLRIATE